MAEFFIVLDIFPAMPYKISADGQSDDLAMR
jgi:hypothetical protein